MIETYTLAQIFEEFTLDPWLFLEWSEAGYYLTKQKTSRRVLAEIFQECMTVVSTPDASSQVRQLWNEVIGEKKLWDLPSVCSDDGFLRMYADALPLSVTHFRHIWKKAHEKGEKLKTQGMLPIHFGETPDWAEYYNVKATPPGLLPKFFSHFRLKKDHELLEKIRCDLARVIKMSDFDKRKFLTLAILCHGASYRELDGEVLLLPSLTNEKPTPYAFRHHLIWEGVKTISATPLEREHTEPGLYLCQGTEIWPSQPSTLGSIYANLSKEGPGTEPYARCWRQIHSHLRARSLEGAPLPIVAGHSLGGSLATQILLYSHPMISEAFAFNPPVVEDRGYQIYHRLSLETQEKLHVFANLDDLPFWRIGSKVIGKVILFLPEERKPYRPIRKFELLLFFPALFKLYFNVVNALPSHQNIFPLYQRYLVVPLSQAEIDKENEERVERFDRLFFIPKFRKLTHFLMIFCRKCFRWKQKEEFLRSQIELIELHEQDLKDTLELEGGEEIQRELEELKRQKEELLRRL